MLQYYLIVLEYHQYMLEYDDNERIRPLGGYHMLLNDENMT